MNFDIVSTVPEPLKYLIGATIFVFAFGFLYAWARGRNSDSTGE
ncbi:hypothetical protein PQ455_06915 [Sphingomonas naphthae]|uniref:Uncharacterized protein n=1 Tax=Sphingomonas naphthae TaxID=1813468 RepID=A0ABY7TNX9_9SPHN|nr:hypothetical protein [Sphingomonas naphthae]WCT74943.1 hypothetical protein PQ455_06915 [Sphingomonas naphthae]